MKSLKIIQTAVIAFAAGQWMASMAAAEVEFSAVTVAGASSIGSTDGRGSDARFRYPHSILLDSAGNLLVADTGNFTIRKITSGGQVSTYSGVVGKSEMLNGPVATARYNAPTGLARDGVGNLYVADELMVRKITADGVVSTLVGWPFIPDVNPPAVFNGTVDLTSDATGNLYIAAFYGYLNYGVIRITPDGKTFPLYIGTNDWPGGVALDSTGKIFYSTNGYGNSEGISSLSIDNTPTRFAGGGKSGSADGVGTAASFKYPVGLDFSANGNLYVADAGNNLIRVITPAGKVSTLAGSAPPPDGLSILSKGALVDGVGSAARFFNPLDLAVDAMNNVYVVDTNNNAIRKITATGETFTIAGLYPASAGNLNGIGSSARFNDPRGIAMGPAGEIYVADSGNHAIRRVTATGTVTTFAATAGVPLWVAADAAGNVYVSEDSGVIEKVARDGSVSTFAGPFESAAGLAVDLTGTVFVADTKASVIHKITPGGIASTLSLTADGSAALLNNPMGLAVDAGGSLYVANRGSESGRGGYGSGYFSYISKISPTGVTSVVAGLPGGFYWSAPGTPPDLQVVLTAEYPRGIAVDTAGNVFVTVGKLENQAYEQKVLKLAPSGDLTRMTILGSKGESGGTFIGLTGLAIDAQGTLYVTDNAANVNTLNKIAPSGTRPTITTQPQSQTVVAGSNVSFSVGASGTPAPAYQWYFNQAAINGATGNSYSLSTVQAKDAGDYSVVVTNVWGEVTSTKATLTLGAAGTTPPPPSSGSSSSGGGNTEAWLGVLLLGLGATRLRSNQRSINR